jgi:two-component system, cell cycle response regulator DivK
MTGLLHLKRIMRAATGAVGDRTGEPGAEAISLVKELATTVATTDPLEDGDNGAEHAGERLPHGVARRRPSAAGRGAGLVLIADDTFDTREIYDLYLTRCGFSVLTAADGEAAVQTAVESRPDVVVLDLSMPRVDGVAATKRLKEHPETRHIPVIVVTGFPHQAAQRRAIEAGADAFLTKPCMPDELEAAVRSLLSRRSA